MGQLAVILLDTHALLYWANEPEKLGDKAQTKIDRSARIGVHVISCFEIAILVEKEKIVLNRPLEEWIGDALSHPKIELRPLSVKETIICTQLPGNFHHDPADRIIAASCLIHNIPLISKNQLIKDWGYVKTVW